MIGVVFRDLEEEDQCRIREEMHHELEEVEVVKMHEKLACYQKMRGCVMQKADMTTASSSKVNPSSLTLEDLVHLVDVSVASKYDADLAQLTGVLAKVVCNTLDLFKHDLDDSLPRKVRFVVKEVIGNTWGKKMVDATNTPTPQLTSLHGGVEANTGGGGAMHHPTNELQLTTTILSSNSLRAVIPI
jgi:hypothetical protein